MAFTVTLEQSEPHIQMIIYTVNDSNLRTNNTCKLVFVYFALKNGTHLNFDVCSNYEAVN